MSAVAPRPAAPPRAATRRRLPRLLTTSIGQKIVMAVTGVVLTLFVLGHMLGNLQAFQGAEALNAYGALLHREPAILWAARVTLLTAIGLHIWAYIALTRKNQVARAGGYREKQYREATFASRSMRITGPFLVLFIVYHILHLTTGSAHPDYHEGDVYGNLVAGLQVVPVAAFYVLAMLALGFHLWHGVWSMFQTLGASQPRFRAMGRNVASVVTVLVVVGFAVIPLAAVAGILK